MNSSQNPAQYQIESPLNTSPLRRQILEIFPSYLDPECKEQRIKQLSSAFIILPSTIHIILSYTSVFDSSNNQLMLALIGVFLISIILFYIKV